MSLHLVGIGLCDSSDITLKGLETVKRCDMVYLEGYTSKLINSTVEDLEKLYRKKIILADRDMVESSAEILENSKTKDVAFLVIGDPLGATTHVNLMLEARKNKVAVNIIHNASILNAIGEIGLELYKFGHVTSIPFENENVKTPLEVLDKNYGNDFHTLFLLDLDPGKNKYMKVSEAAKYLLKNGANADLTAVGCAAIGSESTEIKVGTLKQISNVSLKKYPQCLIIPSKKLHFVEEEALESFK